MNADLLENKIFNKRFWSKIDIRSVDECWNWKAARQSKGYGSIGVGTGKTQLAHRVAYMLQYGQIPEGFVIMHVCDNRLCCNVNHLRLGTIADNNLDALGKGRIAKGERSGRAKLKAVEVIQIRQDYKLGKYSAAQLARLYKVSESNIRNILKNNNWKDLPLAG